MKRGVETVQKVPLNRSAREWELRWRTEAIEVHKALLPDNTLLQVSDNGKSAIVKVSSQRMPPRQLGIFSAPDKDMRLEAAFKCARLHVIESY